MIICLGTTPAIQRSMSFHRIEIDGTSRTSDVQQFASGKSINAARVLRTLGRVPLAIGFAGGDAGRFLVTDLESAGIANDFVPVSPATRMCITAVDRSAGTATELIEDSKPVEPAAYAQLLEKLARYLPQASGVILSGSLPPKAPVTFYADCVAAANAAGKMVLLDATGEPLLRALPQRPTIVKPNRSELGQTVNLPVETDAELKAAISRLIAAGPPWAVVTNGAKETIASDGSTFWKISTPWVELVSPNRFRRFLRRWSDRGRHRGPTSPRSLPARRRLRFRQRDERLGRAPGKDRCGPARGARGRDRILTRDVAPIRGRFLLDVRHSCGSESTSENGE